MDTARDVILWLLAMYLCAVILWGYATTETDPPWEPPAEPRELAAARASVGVEWETESIREWIGE